MVLLAVAAVALSTLIKIDWLTPVLHAGAILPFYYSAMKHQRHAWALILAVRWSVAILLATIALGVFAPARTAASQLLSERAVTTVANWLSSPQAAPPADYSYLLWGLAIFLVGSLISGGVAAFIIASLALGGAATSALFLFAHGNNVLQIMLTALPPWQWGIFACGALLLVPTARPFFDRFIKTAGEESERRVLLVSMYAGAACFVLSMLLRLTAAGAWHDLLQRWTIP